MATIKINDTVFTVNEDEAYTVLELLRNVIMPKVEENTQDITTNTEDINQNKQMLANHSAAITQNAANILKNTNAIEQLESELVPIQDNVADLLSDVETLKTETETLGNDINHISGTDIPEIESNINTLNTKTNQNSQNIASIGVQYNALNAAKYDNATITNENTLNFFANNVLKKSLTLPTGGGGGETGTTIEHIQVLTSNNEPVNAFMMKSSEYALIFLCDICNFSSTDTFTLPENLQANYFLSTGNYTNGEGKVMQAGKLKEIYIVVNNSQRSEIKIMGENAMPVQVGANAFIWAWFMLKLTEA